MQYYLCPNDACRATINASLAGNVGDSASKLAASSDPARCDVFFALAHEMTPATLAAYRFTQLVEIDTSTCDSSLDAVVCVDQTRLLRFTISSAFAYGHRVAKLFLDQLCLHEPALSSQDCQRCDLPLHEAITNAVIHGNLELDSGFTDMDSMGKFYELVAQRLSEPEFARRRVVIEAGLRQGSIVLSVTDQGNGHSLATPRQTRHDQPHGRGFILIRELSEGLEFEDHGRTSKILFRL